MQECFPMLFNVMMERRKYITVFLPNKLLQKFTDFALFIITESIKKRDIKDVLWLWQLNSVLLTQAETNCSCSVTKKIYNVEERYGKLH